MRLRKEEEQICRELGDRDGLQVYLGGQAVIWVAQGNLDAAMALHIGQEKLPAQGPG